MDDRDKTQTQLIHELAQMRRRVGELEELEREHKKAEEALRESEEKLRLLFEKSVDPILMIDGNTFVDCNEAALKIMHCTDKNQLRGAHPSDISPELQPDGRLSLEKANEVIDAALEQGANHFEWMHRTFDGEEFWVDVSLTVIPVHGRKIAYTLWRDITDRKRAEEALRENQERRNTILNNVGACIFLKDTQYRYTYVNSKVCNLFGLKEDEIIGKCAAGFFSAASAEEIRLIDRRVIEYGDTIESEVTLITLSDNVPRTHWVVNLPLRDSGGTICGLCGISTDITEHKKAEEALKEAEQRYRSIFENATEGICQTTPEGKHLSVNPALVKMLGFDSQEEMIETVDDIGRQRYVNPEDRELLKRLLAEHGSVDGFETELYRKDGSTFWVSINTHVVRGADGNILYYEGTNEDITERKRAQEALKESEEALWSLINATKETLGLVDPEGRILIANETMVQRLGKGRKDIIGTCQWDYFPAEVAELRKAWFAAVVRTGRPVRFEDSRAGRLYENCAYPVFDEQGKVSKIALFVTDITEYIRTEEELQKALKRYRLLFNGVNDAVFVHGISDEGLPGRFIEVNNAACRRLGYTREELLQMSPADIDTPESGAIVGAMTERLLEERHVAWEGMHVGKDGRRIPVEIRTHLFEIEGNPTVLSSIRDITERKLAEEEKKKLEAQLRQAQKMEAIGTLAGGIAHDFNNILTALIGYGSLLQMGLSENTTLRTYADQILSSSQKAAHLTQSLLTFSRKQPITLKPMKLNDIITGTQKLLKRLLTEDIMLQINLTADDTTILGDATQIDQILLNIATNARDAMPKGGRLAIETKHARIDEEFIRAHGYGEPGPYVLVSFSDTGIGMDDATRDHIFDPFFTTKEAGKGTGLGLSTVYGIVKQHNGYINVYSERNRGTVFHFYLPAIAADIKEDEPVLPGIERGDETILVAEDNEGVRTLIRTILTQYGYTIIEAVDGEDAIEKFNKNRKVDLLIIDSVMPKKNGREVYDEICITHPHIKTLFTSGYTKDIVLDKGIEEKDFHFISKPLSPNELLRKTREALCG